MDAIQVPAAKPALPENQPYDAKKVSELELFMGEQAIVIRQLTIERDKLSSQLAAIRAILERQ